MQRILLIISSLGAGGAERVMTLLANSLSQRGYVVALGTFSVPSSEHYRLDPSVQRVALTVPPQQRGGIFPLAIRANIARIGALHRAVDEFAPDVVISFLDRTNVSVLLAMLGRRIRVIVSERGNLDAERALLPWIWRCLRYVLYPTAHFVVAQTERAASVLRSWPGLRRVIVIPNPIDPTLLNHPARERSVSGKRVVALGRLSAEKGFINLITAFSTLTGRHPEAELWIWGEGPQRAELEELITRLDLKSVVHLPGLAIDPWEELCRADIFALSSHHEGFPNALLEALALGVPSVACDCPNGPCEISLEGKAALLVPPNQPDLFAEALERLMTDVDLRASLARSCEEVRARYDLNHVLGRWFSLFSEAHSNQ